MDGTFKVIPYIFMQLFYILSLIRRPTGVQGDPDEQMAVPLVFAIMSSKQQ